VSEREAAREGRPKRTLRRDGQVPRARVSVRSGRVSIEVWALSQAAELATQLALVEGALRGGPDTAVIGPHEVPAGRPPKWYGRLLLAEGAGRERVEEVRAVAARVLREAGYLLLPETLTRQRLPKR